MYGRGRLEHGFRQRYPEPLVTIDSHTQGEATRLVVGGIPPLPGTTMQDKREYFQSRYDQIRKLLTREPRGHRDMLAAVVTEPVSQGAQFGLFYMDARRYPYLCGHATIGAVTSLVETGGLVMAEGDNLITIDTPSGPLEARTKVSDGMVESVALEMVPSFVFGTGYRLEVESFGIVPVDLVFMGGFFAMVDAKAVGLDLTAANSAPLISLGMSIIKAANEQLDVYHPERPEVKTVDVAEFYTEARGRGVGAVIYGESHIDRSPCGTGTTAKMTLLHHRGKLKPKQLYQNASPLGTMFEGQVLRTAKVGAFDGVVGEVRGSARITGFHQFIVDPADPFPEGFLL